MYKLHAKHLWNGTIIIVNSRTAQYLRYILI